MYNYIINLIFGNCIYCGVFINIKNTLCSTCQNYLVPFNNIKCIFCHNYTNYCICVNLKYHILYKYNRIISNIILKFKYNSEYDLSIFFANNMVSYINSIENLQNTYVISIPTTHKKLYKRRNNHFAEICKQISNLCNIRHLPFVLKKIKTTYQQNKSSIERLNNANSIELNNIDEIRNKNIIIIDDVIASGATILRCIHLLKPYVNKIYIIAIAKTI